jgi:hypothetical protein
MSYFEENAFPPVFLEGANPPFKSDTWGDLKPGITNDCLACTPEAIERMKAVFSNVSQHRDFGNLVPDAEFKAYQDAGHPFFRTQTYNELLLDSEQKGKEVVQQVTKSRNPEPNKFPWILIFIILACLLVGRKYA